VVPLLHARLASLIDVGQEIFDIIRFFFPRAARERLTADGS